MLFAEVEGPLRAWLKADPTIAALTNNGRHVYFAAPDTNDKPTRWLTIRRIGGGPLPGTTPLDYPLIAFECWGRTKAGASELAEALVNLLWSVDHPVEMDTVVALSAVVTLWLFQPDPALGDLPRVLVDASMVFRAAVAA
jgi:Protein of unknown function (DUF3168)